MRIEFDENDRQELGEVIERAIARGIIRAVRALAREHLWPSIEADENEVAVEVATEVQVPPAAKPRPPEARPAPPRPRPPPEARPAPPRPGGGERQHRMHRAKTDLGEMFATVAERPEGYITRNEAVMVLLDAGVPGADAQLSQWVKKRQVEAVIAGGQLYVLKSSVMQRNQLRLENIANRGQYGHGPT